MNVSFFPVVMHLWHLFFCLLLTFPFRCVRTRESLSHAGQVTSSALSTVGVAVTRRLTDMRYPMAGLTFASSLLKIKTFNHMIYLIYYLRTQEITKLEIKELHCSKKQKRHRSRGSNWGVSLVTVWFHRAGEEAEPFQADKLSGGSCKCTLRLDVPLLQQYWFLKTILSKIIIDIYPLNTLNPSELSTKTQETALSCVSCMFSLN